MKRKFFAVVLLATLFSLTSCNLGNHRQEIGGDIPNVDNKDPIDHDEGENKPEKPDIEKPTPTPGETNSNCVIQDYEQVTIKIKGCLGRDYLISFEDAIARFKKVEPNITVIYENRQGGYESLEKATMESFRANTHPDMLITYSDFVGEILPMTMAADMSGFIDNHDYGWTSEDKNDFFEPFLEQGSNAQEPGIYSLPFNKSTEALFYDENKLLNLELKGVNNDLPLDEPYLANLTWDELFNNLCPALIKYNSDHNGSLLTENKYGEYGILGINSGNTFVPMLAKQYNIPYTSIDQTLGQGKIDFNNEEMKDLFRTYKGYADKHYIYTTAMGDDKIENSFCNGNCLFSLSNITGSKYLDFGKTRKVRATNIPSNNGVKASYLTGPSVCFLKHVANDGNIDNLRLKASWLFYKFLTNKENAITKATQDIYNLPLRKSVLEASDYINTFDKNLYDKNTFMYRLVESQNVAINSSEFFFTNPIFEGSASVFKKVGELFEKVTQRTTSYDQIDTLFKDTYREIVLAI